MPVVTLSFQRQLCTLLLSRVGADVVGWDACLNCRCVCVCVCTGGVVGDFIRIDCGADSVRGCTSDGFIHTLAPSLPLCSTLSLYHRKLPRLSLAL